MRTILTALTALMLFATPVVAGDFEDGFAAYEAGDYQKAFRLFKWLAQQGHVSAQHNLGFMYAKGWGVPANNVKAFYWFRKAAEQGHTSAQNHLALMYAGGKGVSADDAKAYYWWRKAAEQGNASAQFLLGAMYAEGVGVPKDYVKAYAWSSIAATQGYEEAKKNKGIIKKQMTPAQILEAQNLSSEYRKKYVVSFQKP
jgi:TPR repeat protein